MQHTKLSAYKGKRILVTGHTGFKGSLADIVAEDA
jgi:hypothetical protein